MPVTVRGAPSPARPDARRSAEPVVVDAGGLARLTPVHVTMGRLAAGVRGTVMLVAVAAALIGTTTPHDTTSPLSWWWVAPTLVVLVAWTGVYVRVAWTVGLRPWLAATELVLAAGLCLALDQLVPAAAERGTSWVGVTVSMMIIWAQPAGSPWILVPAGLVVAVTFVIGSQLGHRPDDGVSHAITLGVQALAGAAVTRIALSAGRLASRTFDDLQQAQRQAELDAASRADERAQLRTLHNGPLTTLTMAIHSEAQRRPSPLLRRRAAADLTVLLRLAATAPSEPGSDAPARLDQRLAQVVVWYESLLQVSPRLPACLVPHTVADAFAEATAEALENVVRHARTDRATLDLQERDGVVRVTVTDHGVGIAATGRLEQRFGLREAVIARMAEAGGRAWIESAPSEGTSVELEWRRD
jgi:hypothetical protein